MARLTLVILAIFAYVAVTQGKKWKSCERRIQRFTRCLEKGYKSKAGCISGEGTLKKRSSKKCRRLENKIAQKCDYVCEKPSFKSPENPPADTPPTDTPPAEAPPAEAPPAEAPPAKSVPWLDTSCLEEGIEYQNGPVQFIGRKYTFEGCAEVCQSSEFCRAFSSDGDQCYNYEEKMELGRGDIRVESPGFWSMNIECGAL